MWSEKRNVNLLGVSMLLGLFLPHTSTLFLMVNPLMCMVLFYCFGGKKEKSFRYVKFLLCLVVLISLLCSMMLPKHPSNKYILSSVYFLLLFALFPFADQRKIPGFFFYLSIILILFSQLIYLFNLPVLQRTINILYPIREADMNAFEYMTRNINTSNVLNFRLSGIYRNPNQCSRYVCLITAAFLADRHCEKIKDIWPFVLLAILSVVLTGSRTGLVVISIIIGVFMYRNRSINRRLKLSLIVLVVILFIPLFFNGSSRVRGFNVSEGFNNSANIKWDVFADYLSQDNSIFHLLFGYADTSLFAPSNFLSMRIFDSEYGNLIYCYGFLGFVFVIFFYLIAFRTMSKEYRFFMFLLLWAISSTILFSFRMSFLFMFFLSHFVTLKLSSSTQDQ